MRRPRGFTLTEVVVTAAILLILAAVALPTLSGYYNRKGTDETADILTSLGRSLSNANTTDKDPGFLQVISATRKYPQRLSHLTTKITTAADKQCGGTAYAAADTIAWNANAPFSTLNIIPNQGVSTPLGWVHDSVVKGAAAVGTSGWVELHIDSVARDDALALDNAVDGTIDSANGSIRFATATGLASSSTLRLVRFLVPSPVTTGTAQVGCP